MSDEATLRKIDISQSSRWYRWSVHSPTSLSLKEIADSSANMHMIHTSKKIYDDMKRVRKGDIVYLKGKLVEVTDKNGGKWISSLSRTDSGGGACEVVFVESFKIVERKGKRGTFSF